MNTHAHVEMHTSISELRLRSETGHKFQLPLGSRKVTSYVSRIFSLVLPISPHMLLQRCPNVSPVPPLWALSPVAMAAPCCGFAGWLAPMQGRIVPAQRGWLERGTVRHSSRATRRAQGQHAAPTELRAGQEQSSGHAPKCPEAPGERGHCQSRQPCLGRARQSVPWRCLEAPTSLRTLSGGDLTGRLCPSSHGPQQQTPKLSPCLCPIPASKGPCGCKATQPLPGLLSRRAGAEAPASLLGADWGKEVHSRGGGLVSALPLCKGDAAL